MLKKMCNVARCGERYANCCADGVTSFSGGSVMMWGGVSLNGKNKSYHQWNPTQCREITRGNSATSPISPQSGTELCPLPWQHSRPQSVGYQSLPPEFGSEENGRICQQSWSQHHWTDQLATCCSLKSEQYNQVGWLVTNTGRRVGLHPTAVCDQAGEEEVPGRRGCIWFFHTWGSCLLNEKISNCN